MARDIVSDCADVMFVAGRNRRFTATCAVQAEAMAMKEAVNLAIERKFQKVCLKMDSKDLFLVLTNKYSYIDRRVRPLVLDIQEMLKLIPERKLKVVNREANAAANWVAVNSRRGMCLSSWEGHLPSTLVGILDKDELPAHP